MAERALQKPKKRAVKSISAAPKAMGGGGPVRPKDDAAARIRTLEVERDRLAAELQAAQARIKALEQAREQALNRIDWVIDSLHNLIEE